MTDYDFSTLNSTDLENLVCELLNAEQANDSLFQYRTFKEGKDQGVDFLYSSAKNQFEHVGQVKHYIKTGIGGLLKDLRDKEAIKVKKLSPSKYIFATSIPLSLKNCSDIKTIFSPFLKDIGDIYGKDDLNRLISKYKEIEESNYKLWFSSLIVLEKILKTDLEFRSTSFVKYELIKRIKLYVITPVFQEARMLLKDRGHLIITGDPGSGKTTLAEMILYEYINNGYRLSFIIDDVHDAEREIKDDDSKQIIYFDDFLGSNDLEIKKAMASESRLLRLFSQIEKRPNKLLILTTRSNLFAKAISGSEKLKQKSNKLNKRSIDLKEYDSEIKRQILINHIEESDIKNEYKDIFRNPFLEKFIINHRNFSPRAVEYITNIHQVDRVKIDDFEDFIKATLNSPINIWEHAYLNQTNDYEKLFLQTLLTFGDKANISILESAFNKRVEYELKTRNLQYKNHSWRITLSQLMDGFIVLNNSNITFINPSLTDFLVSYLKEDEKEVDHIVKCIIHIDQLSKRLFRLSTSKVKNMPSFLQDNLLADYKSFLSQGYNPDELIRMTIIFYQYVDKEKSDPIICEILNNIDDWSVLIEDKELNFFFTEFLNDLNIDSRIYSIVKSNFIEILNDILLGSWDLVEILEVLQKYSVKFDLESFNLIDVQRHIEQLFLEEILEAVEELKDWVVSEGDEIEKRHEIKFRINEFHDAGIFLDIDFHEFDVVDWSEVAFSNYLRNQMMKDD